MCTTMADTAPPKMVDTYSVYPAVLSAAIGSLSDCVELRKTRVCFAGRVNHFAAASAMLIRYGMID